MEILKLKTVDFTIESNEMKETDMIFSFNNGEIKMYLSYETGEVKEVIFKSGNENFEKKEYNNSDFLNLIGVPALDY